MKSNLLVLWFFLFSSILPITIFSSGNRDLIESDPGSNPAPTGIPVEKESWLWLDLPPDATQLDLGSEVYRLVCSPCHAYDGTGLTDEWRATWNQEDQNCWQSKCHATNHPPDGFYLPYSPPVVGPVIPALFETANDLYEYNHTKMPWHNKNSLTEDEDWAVTAYLLQMNGIDPGLHLDSSSANRIRLRPAAEALTTSPTPAPIPTQTATSPPTQPAVSNPGISLPGGILGMAVFLTALGAIGVLLLRKREA